MRWPLIGSKALFLGIFAMYFGAAGYLDLVANVIAGDALSHVAIAQRVLFSHDPHLAAIGFVWSPLPTLALLPLVPLKTLWPQLTTLGLAGGIVSAICMAAAVIQLRGMFVEMGLTRGRILVLTGAFALHPLVFVFAANGMTEAMLLLFLLVAVRYLARWLRDYNLNNLITTGIALSLAYLTRYEALAGALGAVMLVMLVSFLRNRSERGSLSSMLCDVVIVGAPVALSFLAWAIASWLITGHPFEQFASIYSNYAQLHAEGTKVFGAWSPGLGGLVATQALSLEPALPLLPLAILVGRLRSLTSLSGASLACLGSTLAFMALAELNGSIDTQLRYLIVCVPFLVILAGVSAYNATRMRRRKALLGRLIAAACLLTTIVALPLSSVAMLNPTIDPGFGISLQSIVSPNSDNESGGRLNWTTARRVASDLDRLNLPPGTVLVDDFLAFPIVVASDDPNQFVITSDRDFLAVLADPTATGVRYILVPQPANLGSLDAINRQYPALFENGGGFATLVAVYPKQGINDNDWRLYRIN
jgi:hypothetical protein